MKGARLLARTWRYLNLRHLVLAVAGGTLISLSVQLSTLHINLSRKHLAFVNNLYWYIPIVAVFVLAIVIVEANSRRNRPPLRAYVAAAVAAATLCVAGTYVAGPSLKLGRRDVAGFPSPGKYKPIDSRPTAVFAIGFEGVMHCVIGLFVYVRLRNARFTALALGRTQKKASEAARAAATARLESVRERIDPAWIMQTLEDIERMYWTDPSRAGARLDELIEFLRAAIPQVRREERLPEADGGLVHAAE